MCIRDSIHIDPETVQKKFGIFGEPMMVGTILGIFLGVIAGYDFKKVDVYKRQIIRRTISSSTSIRGRFEGFSASLSFSLNESCRYL